VLSTSSVASRPGFRPQLMPNIKVVSFGSLYDLQQSRSESDLEADGSKTPLKTVKRIESII